MLGFLVDGHILCIIMYMLKHMVKVQLYYQGYTANNKEGGRVSYSSIVPCTAVVRIEARSMIFTVCGIIYGVIVGSHIRVVTQRACHAVGSCVNCENTTREYH